VTVIDWGEWLACDGTCPAARGEPCYALSSGGPQALPPRFADRPHSGRKRAAAYRADPPPAPVRRPSAAVGGVPARRASRKTQTQADAWRALADRQRGTR
jgi:hypothetical protein